VILAVEGAWLFGGLLARWAGVLLIVAGSVGLASTGDADGFFIVALGTVLWLVGHCLYRIAPRLMEERVGRTPLSRRLAAAPRALMMKTAWGIGRSCRAILSPRS
jgi:hypothetical protein